MNITETRSISSPEQFFTPLERPISKGEKIDIAAIMVERLKNKSNLLTAGDGAVIDKTDKNDLLICLLELTEQVIQLETIIRHPEASQ